MKHLLLASTLLTGLSPLLATTAHATGPELNQDVGCDDVTKWTPGSAWTIASSKCHVTAGRRDNMLMQSSSKIKKGDDEKITLTVSNFVAGSDGGKLVVFAGVKMPSAPAGSTVTVASLPAVPDNFTLTSGLATDGIIYTHNGPGNEADQNGSFRVLCESAGIQRVDPVVYPTSQAAHPHDILGASNMQPNWTYQDFRTKAQSSCTNKLDPKNTVNRSAYWFPPLEKGNGDFVKTDPIIIYYKTAAAVGLPARVDITASASGGTLTITAAPADTVEPGEFIQGTGVTAHTSITGPYTNGGGPGTYTISPSQTFSSRTVTLVSPYEDSNPTEAAAHPVGSMCAEISFAGVCANIPRGLAFTGGYKGSFNSTVSTDNNCGPADTIAVGSGPGTISCSIRGLSSQWSCQGGPNGEGAAAGVPYTAVYNTLQEIKTAAVCVTGSKVLRSINFPVCWDGFNADTLNHRDHIQFVLGKCNAALPVAIPHISLLVHYTVWPTFNTDAHLASDDMAACYDPGGIAGCTDHWDYREAWSDAVRNDWYVNCVLGHNTCTNNLGNGYSLKADWLPNPNGLPHGVIFQNPAQPTDTVRPETLGQSRTITANGTYTFYIRAVDNGVFGVMAQKGVTADIDNMSVKSLGRAGGPQNITGGN